MQHIEHHVTLQSTLPIVLHYVSWRPPLLRYAIGYVALPYLTLPYLNLPVVSLTLPYLTLPDLTLHYTTIPYLALRLTTPRRHAQHFPCIT